MTHPLASASHLHPRMLITPLAAVKVKRIASKLLQTEGEPPVVARSTTTWIPFTPGKDISVVNHQGRDIKFSGQAYISADTFDPYHLVVDCVSSTTPKGEPRFV